MSAAIHVRCLVRRVMAALSLCGAALVLAGCAAGPGASAYGNYAAGSAAFNQKLANDSIKQLVALYPPASTQFNIAQPIPDAFGIALVAGLREKGYAVTESNLVGTAQLRAPPEKAASGSKTRVTAFDLRYLLDKQGAGNLYRLALAIGSQSLTRAYVVQDEGTYAAGSWVRKE